MKKAIFSNRKRVIILIAVTAAVLLLLTSCGGNGLEGTTWKYTIDLGSYSTISFANGSCTGTYVNTVTGEHESSSTPCKISGNQITMDGETANWKIEGNTLIITYGDQQVVYERK